MNLIINKMMKLKVIHIAYCNRIIKLFACSAVCKNCFTVFRQACKLKTFTDIVFVRTVKYRGAHLPAESHSSITEVNLKHLSDIHTGRYTKRIKNNIKRTTIRKKRHILLRKYTGYNTLVSVTARHLIADLNFSLLSNINSDYFINTRVKLITVCTGKYLNINNDTVFTVRNTHGSISYFPCFFTEDCTKQSFFSCKLCFTLRCYLTNKD